MKTAKRLHQHAAKRSMERLHVFTDDSEFAKMERNIKQEKCLFLEKKTNRITIVAVRYPDTNKIIAVAYDKTRKCIATILPNEVLHPFLPRIAKETFKFY